MDDLVDFVIAIALTAVLLTAFVVPVVWLVNLYERKQCETYQEITGLDTKYATGMCYIKEGSRWYAWSEYKLRYATKGKE